MENVMRAYLSTSFFIISSLTDNASTSNTYKIPTPIVTDTWQGARDTCISHGMDLPIIENENVLQEIGDYLTASNFNSGDFWIGLKWDKVMQQFRWINSKWLHGSAPWNNNGKEPNCMTDVYCLYATSNQDCGRSLTDLTWKSTVCSYNNYVICQSLSATITPETTTEILTLTTGLHKTTLIDQTSSLETTENPTTTTDQLSSTEIDQTSSLETTDNPTTTTDQLSSTEIDQTSSLETTDNPTTTTDQLSSTEIDHTSSSETTIENPTTTALQPSGSEIDHSSSSETTIENPTTTALQPSGTEIDHTSSSEEISLQNEESSEDPETTVTDTELSETGRVSSEKLETTLAESSSKFTTGKESSTKQETRGPLVPTVSTELSQIYVSETTTQFTCAPCTCTSCTCAGNNSRYTVPTQTTLSTEMYKVDKYKTSSYIRAHTSANDNRFSSKVMGYIGITILCGILTLIVVLDVTNLGKLRGCSSCQEEGRRKTMFEL